MASMYDTVDVQTYGPYLAIRSLNGISTELGIEGYTFDMNTGPLCSFRN